MLRFVLGTDTAIELLPRGRILQRQRFSDHADEPAKSSVSAFLQPAPSALS